MLLKHAAVAHHLASNSKTSPDINTLSMFRDAKNLGILHITGKDTLDLINRMSTNNVIGVNPFHTTHTILTNDKGRIIDIIYVINMESYYLLITSPGQDQVVLNWLDKYTIMEDIKYSNQTSQFSISHILHNNPKTLFNISDTGTSSSLVTEINTPDFTSYLIPYHLGDLNSNKGMGSVSAAPWGSASILVISWMYIKMMGSKGLKSASRISILNANYISKKLSEKYKVLYTGKNGNVAHECIIDIRPIKEKSGITEEDIAKRLIDYGYHAPTMSWPVSGTIMIEPTESENLDEIDRFCNALLSIKDEIVKIESGKFEKKDNPLINAPHTYLELTADEWKHSYSRKDAAFPKTYLKEYKYWAPVARVDNVYGDRNLVCSCPSMDEYKEEAA